MRKRRGGNVSRRGAVTLEYILACALLILAAAAVMPLAMRLIGGSFAVIAEVVASPFPAGL